MMEQRQALQFGTEPKWILTDPIHTAAGLAGRGETPVADDHWRALMMAVQAGDTAAYRRLLVEVGSWLQAYYSRRLPAAMVDDAAQEALLTLHAKRHTYDPSRPCGPWLAAIARYKWIDRLRAMKAAPTEELSDELAVRDSGEAVQSARSLEALLSRLKPAQANAIRLVKLEGLSTKEASEKLGQTISLVKVNIHRGLRQLSELAQEEGHEL
jgi:RNA polymerase sigma-70 factor (ECF subfamily)